MENLLLRVVIVGLGALAALLIVRSLRKAAAEGGDIWAIRIALLVVLPLVGVFALRHALILLQGQEIERLAAPYARYGDPRGALGARAQLAGWLLDCTGEDANAWIGYATENGILSRVAFAGGAGASFVADPEDRFDYTVDRLFAYEMERPRSLLERLQPHPVGTDIRLTLCRTLTRRAHEVLRAAGSTGVVVIGDVETGAILAYAAAQAPDEPPIGVKQYLTPGSINKLMVAGLWWDEGWGDTTVECPASVEAGGRDIRNFRGIALGRLQAPAEVLTFSCNTATVSMAARLRERLGERTFQELYRRAGFTVYQGERADRTDTDFWASGSDSWVRRMSPPAAQVRLSSGTTLHEWGQLSIGQGPIDITVLHEVRLIQAIGNDGIMVKPTIEWSEANNPQEVGRVFRRGTARRLMEAMADVVARGTARSAQAHLGDIGEWSLIGKTGTAQVAGRPDDGWFAGLMVDPDGKPIYTVVVYLREGGPGGSWPARIAAELVSDAIGLAHTP